jgi:fibronectin-binding autotransporter adhesin
MKPKNLATILLAVFTNSLLAQTYTWRPGDVLGGDGTWDTTTTNWNTGPQVAWPSTGTANQAVFEGTAGTVTISDGVTANKLTFNTDGYGVQSSTLSFNGTTPTIDVTTGTTTISSVIAGALQPIGLTKSGAGTLVFSGANSYSGPTTVNGGVLRLDPGASFNTWPVTIDNATMVIQRNAGSTLFNNPVTLKNGGILDANNSSGNFNTIRTLTFENGGTLQRSGAANGDGNFTLSTIDPGSADAVTVTGNAAATISAGLGLYNVTGNSSRFNVADVTSSTATDLLVTGALANGGGGMVNGFTKLGAGTMELRASNTYTGATTVKEGRLLVGSGGTVSNSIDVDGATALLSIATNVSNSLNGKTVTVQNGGVLSMENTSSNWTPIGALTLDNGGTIQNTTGPDTNGAIRFAEDVTVTGDAQSTISARVALGTVTGTTRTFDVADGAADADLLVSGVIVDGNFDQTNNLVKAGDGTMVLSAANLYKGETQVTGGRLVLGSGGSFSSSSSFLVDGGTLSIANDVNHSLNSKPVTVQNGGVLSMENTSANWTPIGALTLDNGGTIQNTTDPDFNGAIRFGGDVTVTGDAQSTISARVALGTTTGTTRTFNVDDGAAATDLLVSGVIVDGNFDQTNSLVKDGEGTMVLSAANAYKGDTTVSAGTLLVNGSLLASSSVTVNGGTLGGTGSVNGSATIEEGTFVAPGSAGVGTLTLGSATLAGTYSCEISSSSADRLNVTGTLSIIPGASVAFSTLSTPTQAEYLIATYGTRWQPAQLHRCSSRLRGEHRNERRDQAGSDRRWWFRIVGGFMVQPGAFR